MRIFFGKHAQKPLPRGDFQRRGTILPFIRLNLRAGALHLFQRGLPARAGFALRVRRLLKIIQRKRAGRAGFRRVGWRRRRGRRAQRQHDAGVLPLPRLIGDRHGNRHPRRRCVKLFRQDV